MAGSGPSAAAEHLVTIPGFGFMSVSVAPFDLVCSVFVGKVGTAALLGRSWRDGARLGAVRLPFKGARKGMWIGCGRGGKRTYD
jgi:hypothetical protein